MNAKVCSTKTDVHMNHISPSPITTKKMLFYSRVLFQGNATPSSNNFENAEAKSAKKRFSSFVYSSTYLRKSAS